MMSIFTFPKSMKQRPAIALAGGLALTMNLAAAAAQQPAAPAPAAPAAAAAPPPAAAAPPAAAGLKEPPCKAIALSQQDEILRLNEFITQLQQQIVRLQRGLLDQAKRTAEPDIVKEAGGKPEQGWDFERNVLRPANQPPAAPPKP